MALQPLPLPNRLAFEWILGSSGTILVGLRIWIHIQTKRSRKARTSGAALVVSDMCLVLTLFMGYTLFGCLDYRNIRINENPGLVYTPEFLRIGTLVSILYVFCLWFIKSSFLAFYYSLKQFWPRHYSMYWYTSCAFVFCTFIVQVVLVFCWHNACSERVKLTEKPVFCSPKIELVAAGIFVATNISTDFLMMILGIILVRGQGYQLARRQLAALVFVILLGLLPIVASALRFMLAFDAYKAGALTLVNEETVEIWSEIDGIMALHAACLPGLRAFVRSRRSKNEASPPQFYSRSTVRRQNQHKMGSETDVTVEELGRNSQE